VGRRRAVHRTRTGIGAAVIALWATLAAPPLAAQVRRDTVPGQVRVGITYRPGFRPGLVVPPLAAAPGLETVADSVRAILRRDLDYSDRFEILQAPDELLRRDAPINYALWNEMGAVWLVVGEVEGTRDAPAVRIMLHDVVYSLLREVRLFPLADPATPEFRMDVHRAADAVVEWATGQRGIAATRIVFTRAVDGGSDLYTVDSDGHGLRRLTHDAGIALSPAWSPDGRRVAFMSYREGDPAIYELDVETGVVRRLVDTPGLDMTPAYAPDGRTLAFAGTVDDHTEIFLYDLERRCCLRRLTFTRSGHALSPSFAPDGRRIAFNSDRLGRPHIFVMSVDGGDPALLSPYLVDQGQHNAAPDWSPTGDRIAYHAWVDNVPQIVVIHADGTNLQRLTWEGRNEDPSWAPDGRHLVYASDRSGRPALWVLDTVTGRTRVLVEGSNVRLPDWSGPLDSQQRLSQLDDPTRRNSR
jgi:TolB protein